MNRDRDDGSRIGQAICRLVQRAVYQRSIEMDEIRSCPFQDAAGCKLVGCQWGCLLLEEKLEGIGAWRLARYLWGVR